MELMKYMREWYTMNCIALAMITIGLIVLIVVGIRGLIK